MGLKTAGNMLMHPVTELEIECRVIDLPDHVEVSIADLDLGDLITAAQVKLPADDMKLITDPNAVVAQVMLAGVTKAAEEETVAAEGAVEPEVLTAKKAEGEDGKPAAPGARAPRHPPPKAQLPPPRVAHPPPRAPRPRPKALPRPASPAATRRSNPPRTHHPVGRGRRGQPPWLRTLDPCVSPSPLHDPP